VRKHSRKTCESTGSDSDVEGRDLNVRLSSTINTILG
jgi:hypothetical protein